MPAPVLLLDGASLWFRSFFGVPTSITAPDGRPVNAVRGFLDTISTLVGTHRPDRLVVCRDLDWRPAWRVARVPSYKAHRVAAAGDTEQVPDELTAQVPMILDLLAAFGIATAGAAGFEADDVLGTLAAAERRDPVIVVSGDRDLLQVVADAPVAVSVLYVGRGMAKATLFGPAEVAEKFALPTARPGAGYAELALLRGDPSDGLPGVAGIGEKTAAGLLNRFGSLAAVLAAVDDPAAPLTKAVRARLHAGLDYLHAAAPVVAVAVDAPVQLSRPTDALPDSPVERARLAALAAELGVATPVARLQRALAERGR